LIATIVAPIDHYRSWDSLKDARSSYLWDKCTCILGDPYRIYIEDASDLIEWEDILYLIGTIGMELYVKILLERVDPPPGTWWSDLDMRGIDIWHRSETKIRHFTVDILPQAIMEDHIHREIGEKELGISIALKCPELLEMTRCELGDDSDIWCYDREHELHLPGMIDPILKDEISWIGTHESPDSDTEYSDPEKWISPSCTRSDDREWETVFTVVVMMRISNTILSIDASQISANMSDDTRLADTPSHTDDIRTMSSEDRASKEREKGEEDFLHTMEKLGL
jgi:hypothetical protein